MPIKTYIEATAQLKMSPDKWFWDDLYLEASIFNDIDTVWQSGLEEG